MPVIKRTLPDGSTEVISSPSVIIKDPETGKFKKAPSKRTIIPAKEETAEPQKAGLTNEVLPVSASSLQSSMQNLRIGSGNNAPIQPFQAPMVPDQITGTVALFGTLLAKSVQFFTRTGNPSLRGSETPVLKSPVRMENAENKNSELDPKDAEEIKKISERAKQFMKKTKAGRKFGGKKKRRNGKSVEL